MAEVLVFNNSRKIKPEIIFEALGDINKIKPIAVQDAEGFEDFIQEITMRNYEARRSQVNYQRMLNDLNNQQAMQTLWSPGKVIVTDFDLYSGQANSNWAFGGFSSTSRGLGYCLISTARMKDGIQAEDIFRHEFGHMFGAPSIGRRHTESDLGLHCTKDLCVMQQKPSIPQSIVYAHERAETNAPTYCNECSQDIAEFLERN